MSETPIFIAFPATILKTGVRFHRLDAVFFKESKVEKRVALGDSSCFHPNTPIMRKPEKYIDPSRLAMPIRLSVMVPLKRQPKNPPTHKRADKTLSRRNNIRTEQSRKDNPRMTTGIDKKQTRTHNKTHHTSRNTKKRMSLNKEDNESKECKHKRQVGPKEGCVPNTKNNKNKYEATKNPLLPQKIVQEHETKTCSVDERNPPQKKETMIL